MTINEYMEKWNLKSKKTVLKWIENNEIPGTVFDEEKKEYVLVPSARVPVNTRAKNATAIFQSMVKACDNRKHLLCSRYKTLTEQEFQGYINGLIEKGYIIERLDDGIVYYDATPSAKVFENDIKTTDIIDVLKIIASFVPVLQYGVVNS